MKRTIALCLLVPFAGSTVALAQEPDPAPTPAAAVATPAPIAASGSYDDGRSAGWNAAQLPGTGGWGGAGLAGGCVLGAIGCLGVTGAGYLFDPDVPPVSGKSDAWRMGYQQAYEKEVKKRRAKAAFVGGTIGTLVVLAVVIAANASASSSSDSDSGQ